MPAQSTLSMRPLLVSNQVAGVPVPGRIRVYRVALAFSRDFNPFTMPMPTDAWTKKMSRFRA